MRAPLEDMKRVSDYLSGSMTPDQRLRFESDLQTNPSLREQLSFQQDLARVVERRAMMKEIQAVSRQYGGGSSFFPAWGLSAIGAIIAISVTAYLLLTPEPEQTKPQLSAEIPLENDMHHTAMAGELPEAPESGVLTVGTRPQMVAERPQTTVLRLLSGGGEPEAVVPGRPVFMSLEEKRVELESVDFEALDFTPKRFRDKLLDYKDLLGCKMPTQQWIDSMYYTFGRRTEAVGAGKTEISGKWWLKRTTVTPLEEIDGSKVPGVKSYRKLGLKRNTAYCVIVDAKGDKWEGLEVRYDYYGEPKKAKTGRDGAFDFALYSPIRSTITIRLPGRGEMTLSEVCFEPKRVTYIQVDLDAREVRTSIENNAAASACGIDPAAIRAIRGDAFRNTFLATRAFEKRLQLLHELENGQELLNVYVEHLDSPLCEVDELISTMISDHRYANAFRLLSREQLDNVPEAPANQQALTQRYRLRIEQFGATKLQVTYGDDRETERKADIYRDLSGSVTPCGDRDLEGLPSRGSGSGPTE